MNKKQLAFTLIELLVVIAIIGILSGLIVVSMSGVTAKATIAKAQVFSNSLRNSLMLNIVAQYTFDDIDSTDYNSTTKVLNTDTGNIPDSWSTNEGTAVGGPTLKEGNDCVSGKCLSFDGSNDYVNCGSSNFSFGNSTSDSPFTFTWWEKMTVSNAARHFNKNDEYHISNSNAFRVSLNDLSTSGYIQEHFGAPSAYIGKWVMFTVTYDGSSSVSGIKAYWDATEKTGTNESSGTYVAMEATGNQLNIGVRGTEYYNGLIDEVRIYNAAIPTSRIKELYFSGLNNLFINSEINKEEYLSRLSDYVINN